MSDESCRAPVSRPERRDAAEHRTQILAAAQHLFAIQGVAATSMQQIAGQAGVGQGTLYRRFAHKGALCAALLQTDLTAFQAQINTLTDGPSAPPSALLRLERLLTELLVMTETHIPLLTAMYDGAVGPRGDDRFHNPFALWLHTRIRDLLVEAVLGGEVADLDLDFTADAIFAAIEPPLFAFQQRQRGFSRERIAAGVRRLFIEGLRITPAAVDRDHDPSGQTRA